MPIDEIRGLVNNFNAELHVINTGKKEDFDPEIIFKSLKLEKLLGGIRAVYHFISNEDTDNGIISFTENNGIDLLIVLPKRHGLIDSLLLESHSKELVLHCHVPIMGLHLQ